MTFIRPVWAYLLAVSVGLVPAPALCPGADAAKRPQEILYKEHIILEREVAGIF
jgi:hypothetical protein